MMTIRNSPAYRVDARALQAVAPRRLAAVPARAERLPLGLGLLVAMGLSGLCWMAIVMAVRALVA